MSINITHLRSLPIEELVQQARDFGLDNAGNLRTSDLIFELTRTLSEQGKLIIGDGILEILSDGFGFLRSPISEYAPGTDDIYVSPSQIRRFNLRTGDHIQGKARAPREGERYFALLQIHKVNGRSPEEERERLLFDTLTAVESQKKWSFSRSQLGLLLDRFFAFSGGQIVLLRAPVRMNMIDLGVSFSDDFADDFVYLCVAAKAEDVGKVKVRSQAKVFASTFGETATRHVQLMEMTLLRVKRLVEQKRDVVLFVDSLTDLLQSAFDLAQQQGKESPESQALATIFALLGAARTIQQGGSLTIVAVVREPINELEQRLADRLASKVDSNVYLSSTLLKQSIDCPVDVHRSVPQHDDFSAFPREPMKALEHAISLCKK